MNEIKIFSPATVSNVACGFDILGFSIESLGDEMIVKKTKKKGLKITKIEGFNLPKDIQKNVAGVSASAMLEKIKPNFGFEIEIFKKIKPVKKILSPKFYKSKIRNKEISKEDAIKQLSEILDIAIMIRYQETEAFENAVRNINAESVLDIFKNQIKLLYF